ncbi:MAG: hypothetical protein RLZZ22_1157 [Pseudomonadota bacterium]|jgi:hypothetical protein
MASHLPVFLLAAVALTGCAVVPGPVVDYGPAYQPAYSTTVYAAPPVPRIEYPGPPPASGQVWVDGYWNWGGSRYLWVPGRWSDRHPGQAWGPQPWPREIEHRRPQGGQWEERRPPQVHPRFQEPDRTWRTEPEPRAPRHEWSPQSRIQPVPSRPAPPVIQQTEPGRAGFMRGLAERAQAERPVPVPRSVEVGPRHPPEPGRRGGRWLPEDGEASGQH